MEPDTLKGEEPVRLKELIERLEALPADLIFEKGFCDPHSWRGVYAELSFAPAENVSVASMLVAAKEAVGKEYTGYKGGEYTMGPDTAVHLDHYGECSDDGDRVMELFGQVAPKRNEVLAGAVDAEVPSPAAASPKRGGKFALRSRVTMRRFYFR